MNYINQPKQKTNYLIVSFYKFVPLKSLIHLQKSLYLTCLELELLGSILLAEEGINATIAGLEYNIHTFLEYLKNNSSFEDLECKFSSFEFPPFQKLKILIKKEIVTFKVPNIEVKQKTGVFIAPEKWNDLISEPDVLVVDTRNNYETSLGTFKNAIDPETNSFSEFPEFVEKNLSQNKHKKIAMFCTGGIRCEKASAFLLNQGFENVYQLQGGILKYLECIPREKSLWQGECFIFDDRRTLDKDTIL